MAETQEEIVFSVYFSRAMHTFTVGVLNAQRVYKPPSTVSSGAKQEDSLIINKRRRGRITEERMEEIKAKSKRMQATDYCSEH